MMEGFLHIYHSALPLCHILHCYPHIYHYTGRLYHSQIILPCIGNSAENNIKVIETKE